MEDQTKELTQKGVIKREVSDTLRNMKIGGNETFPIEQMTSVRNTIFRLRKMEKLHFSTTTTDDDITATRNA